MWAVVGYVDGSVAGLTSPGRIASFALLRSPVNCLRVISVGVFVGFAFRCGPILTRLEATFAPAVPRPAVVDLPGFEREHGEEWAVDGEAAYHARDKRLTHPRG